MAADTGSRRIAVIGNANADSVIRIPGRLEAGREYHGAPLGVRLGGSGANAACPLVAAGNQVALFSEVGRDAAGDDVLAWIKDAIGGTKGVTRRDAATGGCTILIDETGDRTIIGNTKRPGPAPWPDVDIDACDAVYFAANRLVPEAIAARLAQGRPPVIAQLGCAPRLTRATAVLASHLHLGDPDPAKGWETARERGISTAWLIVTRGAAGAWASNGETVLHQPALPAEVVDTTGAGDAFAAGIVHALARGWSMVDALRLASLWGAYTVGHLGSSCPPNRAPPMCGARQTRTRLGEGKTQPG